METPSNVVPITTDPLVQVRAILAEGQEEFWEAIRGSREYRAKCEARRAAEMSVAQTQDQAVVPITTDPVLVAFAAARAQSSRLLALGGDRLPQPSDENSSVVAITTDPLVQVTALLAHGRKEFHQAIKELREYRAQRQAVRAGRGPSQGEITPVAQTHGAVVPFPYDPLLRIQNECLEAAERWDELFDKSAKRTQQHERDSRSRKPPGELATGRSADPNAAVLRRRDVALQAGCTVRTIDRHVEAGLLRSIAWPIARNAAGEVEKTTPRFTQADVDAYLRSGVRDAIGSRR